MKKTTIDLLQKERKPSKLKKWTRNSRNLTSRKKLNKMVTFSKEKMITKYLHSIQQIVSVRIIFHFDYISIHLGKIRALLRSFFGKLKEKQLIRIHRWNWKEKKKNLNTFPNCFLEKNENKLIHLLFRSKFFERSGFFFDDLKRKKNIILLNQNFFIHSIKNTSIKKPNILTIPFEFSKLFFFNKKKIFFLNKIFYNLKKIFFPWKKKKFFFKYFIFFNLFFTFYNYYFKKCNSNQNLLFFFKLNKIKKKSLIFLMIWL